MILPRIPRRRIGQPALILLYKKNWIFFLKTFFYPSRIFYISDTNQLKESKMESPNKSQLINKIAELSTLLGITGSISEDGQSLFIAHSTMTILTASQDPEHANLLMKHLHNFISEVQVIQGKKTIGELVAEKLEECKN